MCRVPVKLRELVKQRLAAAAEEIFELLERTIAEYEEETERQRRLLDQLLQPRVLVQTRVLVQPRVLVHETADWRPLSVGAPKSTPGLDQDPEEGPQVKEEQEEESSGPEMFHSDIITSQLWKREEEAAAPPTGPSVSVKTEEEKVHSGQPQGQTEHCFNEDQVHVQASEMDLMPHSSSQFHTLGVPEDEVDDPPPAPPSEEFPACFRGASGSVAAQTKGGEKRKIRHTCPFCGKAFVKTDNFKCHLRTHTGEKPFSCAVCGKRFAYHASFNNHRQLHSGQKPFSCAVCGKDFTLKIGLRQHMFTHNLQKPFSCSVCGKGFCVKQGLSKHMRHHTTGDMSHL